MTDFEGLRARMVETQLKARGIRDVRVLAAMGRVPREAFLPDAGRTDAYEDGPLPIGAGQTMSQPYIVALMSDLLDLKDSDRVLEIGTGSGYQTAVLTELGARVFSIECVDKLARPAAERLESMGCDTVEVRTGDGFEGWPDRAPFDAIIVTAAPELTPPALVEQLAKGGRMVIPLGRPHETQFLTLITKDAAGKVKDHALLPVAFVPLVPGVPKTP